MKIKNVRTWSEHFELSRPYTIAFRTVTHVSNSFVELTSDCGLTALGNGSPEPHVTGESFEDCSSALESFDFDQLRKIDLENGFSDALSILSSLKKTPAARAAVDIALYDLVSKKTEKPLAQYLGQEHQKIATSITIGIKPIDEVLEEAKEYQDRKFKIIKLKLGKELELDIERTRKLRELVKSDMKIRVDLNQGYNLKELKTYLHETKNCDIEFCEQPLPVKNFEDIIALDKESKNLIAADESLLTPENAEQIAAKELCGIFNIKLMKCGGITSALEISKHANSANIDLMWGCMDESQVSISAALHAAFACKNTRYLDLDGHLDLGRDLVHGSFTLEDGWMSINDRHGLGYVQSAGQS